MRRPPKKRYPDVDKEVVLNALKSGLSPKQVAKEYGITIAMVYSIKDTAEKFNSNTVESVLEEIKEVPPIKQAEANVVDIGDIITSDISEVANTSVEDPTPVIEPAPVEPVVKKKRSNITDDTVAKIVRELSLNKLSKTDIAKKYQVSYSSVMRIQKAHEEKIKNKPMFSTALDSSKFMRLQGRNFVRLGLIYGRHPDMPTDNFIYDGAFDSELISDYEKQYELADYALQKEIKFVDGKPINGLMLYTTGLQPALVSVLKVVNHRNIPTIVMHYNTDTCAYDAQDYNSDMLADFCDDIPYVLEKVIERSRQFFLYDCSADDITNAKNIWEVCRCQYDSPSGSINRSILWIDTVVFVNEDAAWTYFREQSNAIEENQSIYLNSDVIKNGRLSKDGNIARSTD